MPEEFVIGPGVQQRIQEVGARALGPEQYIAPQYSVTLTDKGPIFYSGFTNEVIGPSFDPAP